jgi:hypothetical protein
MNVVRLLAKSAQRLTSSWDAVSYPCSSCGRGIDPESVSQGELAAWCPHCNRVTALPLLKIPGWIVGILALLAIKLQSGI